MEAQDDNICDKPLTKIEADMHLRFQPAISPPPFVDPKCRKTYKWAMAVRTFCGVYNTWLTLDKKPEPPPSPGIAPTPLGSGTFYDSWMGWKTVWDGWIAEYEVWLEAYSRANHSSE